MRRVGGVWGVKEGGGGRRRDERVGRGEAGGGKGLEARPGVNLPLSWSENRVSPEEQRLKREIITGRWICLAGFTGREMINLLCYGCFRSNAQGWGLGEVERRKRQSGA